MERGNCKKCNSDCPARYNFCGNCIVDLRRAGTCERCGEKPCKSKRSKFCAVCQLWVMQQMEPREPEYEARYRDGNARENRYETRSGG